jgi:beta-propeller repeat-containing protein
VTGRTDSPDFPTKNPLSTSRDDIFVTKLSASGNALIYSTYLIGSGGTDEGFGIAVDPDGNAYVTGAVNSQTAYVAKLNPSGTALLYFTYLEGSGNEAGRGIAVDSDGNAYVTGWTSSPDFPTANPLQPEIGDFPCAVFTCNLDAFVAKLNPSGTALLYSTYLGGSGFDMGLSIAVDPAGNAYVTGLTGSSDFPTQNPLQSAPGGGFDSFVAKLNATGTALVYSTYLGGSGDENTGLYLWAADIAIDNVGNAFMTGYTSSPDFPTANPLQPTLRGFSNAFVAKIGSDVLFATIDIKPGSSTNSINPRSHGNIPVAILTTNSFDANSVDPSTVRFGRKGKEAAPLRSSLEDIDGDGDVDLVLHFDTQQTGLLCGDSSARLTGKTLDGQATEGSDSIRTVGCQK